MKTEKEFERPTIDQVKWVFDVLWKHAREGGSYRYLIYDLLGFAEDSGVYHELLDPGMALNNLFAEFENMQIRKEVDLDASAQRVAGKLFGLKQVKDFIVELEKQVHENRHS